MQNTARRPKITVPDDGSGIVSRAGALLLTEAGRITGLQQLVKSYSPTALGEVMTYEAEDLTEKLDVEVRFITGDRVDLLMRDDAVRYVALEVEPYIGPEDRIGFHPAGKYRVLIAMEKNLLPDQVRALVAAVGQLPMLPAPPTPPTGAAGTNAGTVIPIQTATKKAGKAIKSGSRPMPWRSRHSKTRRKAGITQRDAGGNPRTVDMGGLWLNRLFRLTLP